MPINISRVGPLQIRVFAICGLVAMLDGYDIQAMAFVVPTLVRDWGLPAASFKLALTASLIGIAVGAMGAGPISDRYGRKKVLLGALVLLGLATLGNALAVDQEQLFAYRLFTGIGLGASMPNVIALTAEYAPARQRTLIITLMFCGVPVGGAAGGVISAHLIQQYSWQWVFLLGGAIPVALFMIAAVLLPESIRYLENRPQLSSRLLSILASMNVDPARPGTTMTTAQHSASSPVSILFADGKGLITLILWGVFFCNLFSLYYLVSWLPAVLQISGWNHAESLRGAALFQGGGLIGGLTLSYLIDRNSPYKVLPAVYFIIALTMAVLSMMVGTVMIGLGLLVISGAGIIGAQFCINALAASLYPTRARATGVGWALGIGRLGAILSPLAAAALVSPASVQTYFIAVAIPSLLAASGIVCLHNLCVVRSRDIMDEPAQV